jgi:phage terminase large subunit-like protein
MRLLPGQRAFITDVYGTRQPSVRIGVKSGPRGDGKTGLATALALCHLLGPMAEPRGEVYSASIDRAMAGLIFDEMAAIISAVPAFEAVCNIQRFTKKIEVLSGAAAGSKYEALSADARRGHGLSPTLWIYDELAQAKDAELLNNLITAMGKRARSLGLVISTQADTDLHPLSQLIDDAGADPTIVVHLTAAPPYADPFDPATIRAANPALGIFLNEADVFAEAARARRVPAFAAAFRNRRLNQRVAAEGRWLPLDAWDACAPAEIRTARSDSRRVFGGLDLAAVSDLCALALWFPDDDGTWGLTCEFWMPADVVAERERADRVPYAQWIDAGLIHATPGNTTDYAFIERRIYDLMAALPIVEIGADPWNSRDLLTRLQQNSVPIFEVPQTVQNLSAAAKKLEELVLSGRLRHDGSPVMAWMVRNCVVTIDANGNIKPDKKRSREKIDGVSAAVTGLARALIHAGPSIYESRPPVLLDL